MAVEHRKTMILDEDDTMYRFTYVQPVSVVIDEKGLRKALGARTFDKYTVRKLNRKAMEQAMERGEVSPMVVAKYVTEKPSQPHLKYSVKVHTEKEDE